MNIGAETVIAVTGATRGIGRATSLALAGRGARIAVLARDAAALDELEAAMRAAGAADVFPLAGDVSEPAVTSSWMTGILDRWGRIDVLVNNAGFSIKKPVEELTDEDWRAVIETNLTGPFRLMRAAVPPMKRQGGGHIINVSSISGEVGFPGGGVYCASKFGLQGVSDCLMQEVRRDGIKVTILGPGSVDTRFDDKDPAADNSWKIPPEEIARTIVYLIESPDNTVPTKVQIRPTLKGR